MGQEIARPREKREAIPGDVLISNYEYGINKLDQTDVYSPKPIASRNAVNGMPTTTRPTLTVAATISVVNKKVCLL